MIKVALRILGFLLLANALALGQWLPVTQMKVSLKQTELGGPLLVMDYELADPTICPEKPAFVFVRWSRNPRDGWQLLRESELSGSGVGVVETSGPKQILWWGTAETSFERLAGVRFALRAIRMARIPGGQFTMKSVPGGGHDRARIGNRISYLPAFHMAVSEISNAMYADYLNEVGGDGAGWNPRMSECCIQRSGQAPAFIYSVQPGKENHPVTQVSWYDALAFLTWCGLSLPTEAEWEKAYRGGKYLDGDEAAGDANPLAERLYPWGDEAPDAGGLFRCNLRGANDGFPDTAPVCSFAEFNSPYGICDLAGNVAEWTLDWYTTEYHVGLDGIRMVRGGSWRSSNTAVDAISGATSLPLDEGGIIGFRGVRRTSPAASSAP